MIEKAQQQTPENEKKFTRIKNFGRTVVRHADILLLTAVAAGGTFSATTSTINALRQSDPDRPAQALKPDNSREARTNPQESSDEPSSDLPDNREEMGSGADSVTKSEAVEQAQKLEKSQRPDETAKDQTDASIISQERAGEEAARDQAQTMEDQHRQVIENSQPRGQGPDGRPLP